METPFVERIYLIGPSGSGKSTVATKVATLLNWSLVDNDAAIERTAGRTIPAIFAEDGEAGFRALESSTLAETAQMKQAVVATGGGIGERAENLALMRTHGWVVTLTAAPEVAYQRMRQSAEADDEVATERPMLAGGHALDRLRLLDERRRGWYAQADDIIVTDDLDVDSVAARVVAGLVARGLLAPAGAAAAVRRIQINGGSSYDAVIAWGGLATLGARLAELRLPPRLHIVADANVAMLYEPALMSALIGAGFEPLVYRVPEGETSKSREQLNAIHDWLAERRAERGEALIALGGGVVGDLAGFAAATYLRGIPLIQVPTSLLAQVDASIGGKVAIDHPRGKNLIGAFYQPCLVLADTATLLTLPPRQRTEGWAEIIKHGVALDGAYFETLERETEALLALQPEPLTRIIAGSVALKASVVEGDEREHDGGRRHLLNYGHTIAHAIESVAGYGAWLHGEAVAVGMAAEARLGLRLGITPADVVARQDALLARYDLPTRADGFSAAALLRACLWDKKVSGGRIRWVVPAALGSAMLVSDVSDNDVMAALMEIGANAD